VQKVVVEEAAIRGEGKPFIVYGGEEQKMLESRRPTGSDHH
jgi:hypothetical protein